MQSHIKQKVLAAFILLFLIVAWPFFQPIGHPSILNTGSVIQVSDLVGFGVDKKINFFVFNAILTICFFILICGFKKAYKGFIVNLLTMPFACELFILVFGGDIQQLYYANNFLGITLVILIYAAVIFALFTPITNFMPWIISWLLWCISINKNESFEISIIKTTSARVFRTSEFIIKFAIEIFNKNSVKKVIRILNPLFLSLFLVVIVIELPWRQGDNNVLFWLANSMYAVSASIIFIWLTFYSLRILFSRIAAYILVVFLTLLASISNFFKVKYWGIPFLPNDLNLIGQLFDSMIFLFAHWAYVLTLILVLKSGFLIFIVLKNKTFFFNNDKRMAIFGSVAFIFYIILYVMPAYAINTSLMPRMWQFSNITDQYSRVGFIPGFIYNLLTSHVSAPAGYNKNSIHTIISNLPFESFHVDQQQVKTNVVVIQSEAFWDPGSLRLAMFPNGAPGDLSVLCMQVANKACKTGYVDVPVFGGGTANTEFEFLTGISNKLFPPGATPYIQYIHQPLPSVPWRFRQAGYETDAIHPFIASFWNRQQVYPRLGFETFLTLDDFQNSKTNTMYVSDDALTAKIIDKIEGAKKPVFIFAVSMANHGPFSDDRYKDLDLIDINWDASPKELNRDERQTLLTYSIGVRESRRALSDLLKRLSVPNAVPTIVVLYGDHLPILGADYRIYKKTGFVKEDYLEPERKMYSTPYIVWSNSIELKNVWPERLPIALLGQRLAEEANLGKTNFSSALEKIQLNPIFYKSNMSITDAKDFSNEKYEELYRQISFDIFFGEKKSWEFYGLTKP